MKKIVHVCVTAPWSEIYAYQENLLPHYHRLMGHEVVVLAPVFTKIGDYTENRAPVGESILQDGIKVIRLAPLIDNGLLLAHMPLVRGLKSAILKESPDIIFVHDVSCFNYRCLTSVKKKIPHVKIVFDNHSDYVNSLHSPITRFLHKFIYRRFLLPKLIDVAEKFYGVTPLRCDFLHEVYAIPMEKIELLVMGADDEAMRFDQKDMIRAKVRQQYGIGDDDFLIVSGGKIDLRKNIHVLAEAVAQSQCDHIKMLIFGSIHNDLKPYFAKLQSERIITIGWLPSQEVYRYFYASDIVMFPGLHSVLWEQAVASQVPCAFNNIVGFDHVDYGGNCIFMDEKTTKYYQELIEKLYVDRDYYQLLLKNAHSDMSKLFLYSNISQKVLDDLA